MVATVIEKEKISSLYRIRLPVDVFRPLPSENIDDLDEVMGVQSDPVFFVDAKNGERGIAADDFLRFILFHGGHLFFLNII